MTLTIPISRFRRLLFAVLQTIAPARAPAAAHAQLAQLYDRWGTAVFRAAYAYLRNKSDAEDVLQDTFLQYMRTSPELESSAHEKAWLLRVAINLSKSKLNSAWFKHTNALEESYPCDDLDSDLAFVWDAVRALPPKYREPIHLFYHPVNGITFYLFLLNTFQDVLHVSDGDRDMYDFKLFLERGGFAIFGRSA